MKAKAKSTKTLQVITAIFAVYLFALIVIGFILGNLSFTNLNDIFLLVLLLIFLIGFAFSWKSTKMAGIILMIFNASAFFSLFFNKFDSGILTGVPIMVIGALFLLEWYKTSKVIVPSKQQQWKFILRVLLINYIVLYGIIVISELISGKEVDYFSLPYIIFPLLLLIFLVGFVLSWKKELFAGFIFLFWCVVFILGAIAYTEILQAGPWLLFGLAILLQGMFYIKNHYEFRTK